MRCNIYKNNSDDKMFPMLYSFDANQAFDPLSLVTSLLMVPEEGIRGELQAAGVTPDGRLVADNLRHGEGHRLLHRTHGGGGGVCPGNILENK